jgi:hypothetical protein
MDEYKIVNRTGTPVDNDYAKFTDANTIEGRSFSEVKTDLSLGNVTNESKATMFTSPTFTGNVTASGNISASGITVAGDLTVAGSIIHSGDTDTKIAFTTNAVEINAGALSVFESSVTGSVLPSVHQNVFDTGSVALAANSAFGDIVKFGGSTTVAGGVYYLKSDGTWGLAQANAVGTATSSLAVAVGTNSTTDGMCLRGFVNPFTDPDAGTGNPVYLSDVSQGRFQATAPDSNNDVVRILGYQYGTDLIYFNPSNDFIVITA